MNRYTRMLALLVLSTAVVFIQLGCKKFTEVPAPTTSLVATNVFTKNSTATAAVLSIYAQMQSSAPTRIVQTGLLSDEFTNYGTGTTQKNLYANALNVNTDASALAWSSYYSYIYQSNAVIEGVSNSADLSFSVKQQLLGECKFLRAYNYLILVSLYGDVPLPLGADYAVNMKLERSPKDQVFSQIIKDLTEAQSLLNSNYVDASDTVATTFRIRPNKWAATALLARTYLYNSNWGEAESQSSAVISNSSLYSLPANLNSIFLIPSSEAIWQLQPNIKNTYTPEGSILIITTNIATSPSVYRQTLSPQLLSAFESGDARKASWVGSYTSTSAPIATYQFPYKYKSTGSATLLTEYSTILRLAEQYLIRAEARAKQNKLSEAIADLNVIRNRAGLSPLSSTLTQSQVLAAVAQERRVELFAEGHRWIDLKRTNTIDAVMTIVTPQKGGTWSSYQQWYPIPQNDINNSSGAITQTAGY